MERRTSLTHSPAPPSSVTTDSAPMSPTVTTTTIRAGGLPDCEGYLEKTGGKNPAYKRRWCILRGNILSYYTSPPKDEKSPQGSLDVSKVLLRVNADRSYSWQFVTADRTMSVASSGPAEYLQWLSVLRPRVMECAKDVIQAVEDGTIALPSRNRSRSRKWGSDVEEIQAAIASNRSSPQVPGSGSDVPTPRAMSPSEPSGQITSPAPNSYTTSSARVYSANTRYSQRSAPGAAVVPTTTTTNRTSRRRVETSRYVILAKYWCSLFV